MKQNKIPRNEYIRKPVGKTNPYKYDTIYTDMGQWKYPGQVTKIPSGDITMQGVPYPVYGQDDLGYSQMMYPGMDYQFPGQYVTEIPMAQDGLQATPTYASGKEQNSVYHTNPQEWLRQNFLANKAAKKTQRLGKFITKAGSYLPGVIGVPLTAGSIIDNLEEQDYPGTFYDLLSSVPGKAGFIGKGLSLYNDLSEKAYGGLPKAQKGKQKGNAISDWWYNTDDVQSTYNMAPDVDPFLVNWLQHPETQKRLSENLKSSILTNDINPKTLTKQAVNKLNTLPMFSRELVKKAGVSKSDIEYNNSLQGWKTPISIFSNPYFSGHDPLELGVYMPDYHVSMVNTFKNPGVIAHEQTHSTGPLQEAMEDVIFTKYFDKKKDPDKRFIEEYGEYTYDDKYNRVYEPLDKVKERYPGLYRAHKERQNYLDRDGMYPRIMDIRRTLNLKPGQKVNKSILSNESIDLPVYDLRNYYDDDTIIDMLNTIAKNNTNQKLNAGAYGGDPSLPNIEGHYKTGGWLDKYQKGGASRADSLALYNNAIMLKAFYDKLKPYYKTPDINKFHDYDKNRIESGNVQKETLEYPDVTEANKNIIRANKDPNISYLSDMITGLIDPNAPLLRYDKRIRPQGSITYLPIDPLKDVIASKIKVDNKDVSETEYKREKLQDMIEDYISGYKYSPELKKEYEKFIKDYNISDAAIRGLLKKTKDIKSKVPGAATTIPYYDPLAVKPADMLTPEEKILREQKYGKKKSSVKPSMTKDKSGRPVGIIGQTSKMWSKKDVTEEYWNKFIKKYPGAIGLDPNNVDKDSMHSPIYPTPKNKEPEEVITPDYLPMIQTGMPDMISREPEIIASPTPRPSSTNNRISWRMDPETRKMVPVYLEGKTQKVKEGKRLYNKYIPSSTAAIPADFVPQFEPDENKDVVSKKMGGWLDKYQTRGEVKPVIYTDKALFDKAYKAEMDSLNAYNAPYIALNALKKWQKNPTEKNKKNYIKLRNGASDWGSPVELSKHLPNKLYIKNARGFKNIIKWTDKNTPDGNEDFLPYYKKPVIHNVYQEPEVVIPKVVAPEIKIVEPKKYSKRSWEFTPDSKVLIYKDAGGKEIGRETYSYDNKLMSKKGDFKTGGWLDAYDDEYRRGGQRRRRGTSKNIQSSINDIFRRNYDVFGPAGKSRFNPRARYEEGGYLKHYQGDVEGSQVMPDEAVPGVNYFSLPEVTVKPKTWLQKVQESDFIKQIVDRLDKSTGGKDWYKDPSKGIGSALAEVVSLPFAAPQLAATYGVTGKVQTPSEAMDVENPFLAFGIDAILDPSNLLGAGLIDDVAKLPTKVGKAFGKKISNKTNDFGEAILKVKENMQRSPNNPFKKTLSATEMEELKNIRVAGSIADDMNISDIEKIESLLKQDVKDDVLIKLTGQNREELKNQLASLRNPKSKSKTLSQELEPPLSEIDIDMSDLLSDMYRRDPSIGDYDIDRVSPMVSTGRRWEQIPITDDPDLNITMRQETNNPYTYSDPNYLTDASRFINERRFREGQTSNYITNIPPVLQRRMVDKVQEYPVINTHGYEPLINTLTKRSTANPAGAMRSAVKTVLGSPKGSKFIPSGSLSSDSYNMSLRAIPSLLDKKAVNVNFLGYNSMNTMGYLTKAGQSPNIIADEMNTIIKKLNKKLPRKEKIPYAVVKDDNVLYPGIGVTRKKMGGWLDKYNNF